MRASTILIVLQSLILAVLVFGDIGFDKPGRYGFDFDSLIQFSALYVGLLIGGVAYALYTRSWKTAALQLAMPLLVYFLVEAVPRLRPPLNPADYQHLVGKARTEVWKELGNRRHLAGAGGGESGEWEWESYDGMTVFYSIAKSRRPQEGRVLSVKSGNEFDPN